MLASLSRLAVAVSLAFIGATIASDSSFAARTIASTDIQTMVCGADSAPTITVDSPKSDTTVTSNLVTIEGAIQRARHIVVIVDGVYDQTVSIVSATDRYSLDVNLEAGTRTIQLEVLGICGDASVKTGLVVTVAPGEQPALPPMTIRPAAEAQLAYEQAINAPSGLRQAITPSDALKATGLEIMNEASAFVSPFLFVMSSGTAVFGATLRRWQDRLSEYSTRRRIVLVVVGITGAVLALIIGG